MLLKRNLNFLILATLSPLLLMLGFLPDLLPQKYCFLCTNPYYSLFQINLGMIGCIMLFTNSLPLIRAYNIFLGLIFVYQAVASSLKFFPAGLLHYTLTDDIIHTDAGLILLFVGILATPDKKKKDLP